MYNSKHLAVLRRAPQEDLENEFIISGSIDKFFIQFELGWKLLKELLAHEGKPAAGAVWRDFVMESCFGKRLDCLINFVNIRVS